MNSIYTVAQYARIYKAKHGGSCHRNYIYQLIRDNNLPKGVKKRIIAGKTFIVVKNNSIENQTVTEID